METELRDLSSRISSETKEVKPFKADCAKKQEEGIFLAKGVDSVLQLTEPTKGSVEQRRNRHTESQDKL